MAKNKEKEQWVEVGIVGVDSVRITITDYPNEPQVQNAWELMEKAGWPHTLQLNFQAGHPGAGVTICAGLGDGVYPVYVRYEDVEGWGKRVAEAKIVFLPHPVLG